MSKISNYLFISIIIFFCNFSFAQHNYQDVLLLLLQNKRTEARLLFDKKFNKTKKSDMDLLMLDGFIRQESGQTDFDESILIALEQHPDARFILPAFMNNPFIFYDIKENMYNDLIYKKIDFLSGSPLFKDLNIVKYRKLVLDKRRNDTTSVRSIVKSFNVIDRWQFCGVFENLNGSGMDIVYGPEGYAKNDTIFDANSNGLVGWYNTPDEPIPDPYIWRSNEGEYGSGIVYAQTFIEVTETQEYILSFGAQRGIKIFLNDQEVYFDPDNYMSNLDGFLIKIQLKKGFNRLLLKLESEFERTYFSAQIKRLDMQSASELKYFDSYQPYPVSTNNGYETVEMSLDFEKFFDQLVEKYPQNDLYRIYQHYAYMANNKKQKAFEPLNLLINKYPNSSMINSLLINYYGLPETELQKQKEILHKIENNDELYCLVIAEKIRDEEWITKASVQELETLKNKIQDLPLHQKLIELNILARKGLQSEVEKSIKEILELTHNNEQLEYIYSNYLSSNKKDKQGTIDYLKDKLSKKNILEFKHFLAQTLYEQDKKDEAKTIYYDIINEYPLLNRMKSQLINILISENAYEDALALVDLNLANFPYSLSDMENKGVLYSHMNNQNEAIKWYQKYLIYYSGNIRIRNKLNDLLGVNDEISEIETKDIYRLIERSRKTTKTSEDGVVILLDENIENIYPEGGSKTKTLTIYKITSDVGIEALKEMNANLRDLKKAEIIKVDGTVVPVEKGIETMVLSGLQVGDVILIEYEYMDLKTGRFTRDISSSFIVNGSYPVLDFKLTLITPEVLKINSKISNCKLEKTEKKLSGKVYTTWSAQDIPSVPVLENLSPCFYDRIGKIEYSSIASWSTIADWYSDMVRKNLKPDKILKNTFDSIFPIGTQNISQDLIARKIYEYIGNNILYSYQNFRQSNFIPQRPSKTITTKLGDCKDVSALFVALSNMAGIKSNLVLVSTNSNGINAIKLPGITFDHCIVKTYIDGIPYYLELTDKFLPFKALGSSLFKAQSLEISLDKNENRNAVLENIDNINALKNIRRSKSVVDIGQQKRIVKHTQEISGTTKSYFNSIFYNQDREANIKKTFEDELNNIFNKSISITNIQLIQNEKYDSSIFYQLDFNIHDKLQTVGNMKLFQIPFVDMIYTQFLISEEERSYDLNYQEYEANEYYETEMVLNLEEGRKYVEVPENKSFSFKDHRYEISFELLNPASLKVCRKAIIDRRNISVSDYALFKKYVQDVIEIETTMIAFK